jgi:hypothetical protein
VPHALSLLSPDPQGQAGAGLEVQPAHGPTGRDARWFKNDGELLMWTGNEGWRRFMGPNDWRPIVSPAHIPQTGLPAPCWVYTAEVAGHA